MSLGGWMHPQFPSFDRSIILPGRSTLVRDLKNHTCNRHTKLLPLSYSAHMVSSDRSSFLVQHWSAGNLLQRACKGKMLPQTFYH
ncbi:hypothetical protein BaRGS_00020089 [Batillaria attramentaria]|uniref:Uncharacterized protein n=1 Tax=Batillaria attramentaria TaxID=370345 RepID=A0ABD0KN16_9CAEN